MVRWLLTSILLIFSSLTYAGTSVVNYADTVRFTCTAKVDGVAYTAYYYASNQFEIRNAKGALVLKLKTSDTQLNDMGFAGCKFLDFDGDGYKDFIIEYIANVPAICDLFTYNRHSKKFVKVNGFNEYPAPVKLPGTKVYYSYHRSGCADMNWDSDLFLIKNFRPVKIGNINGAECGDSDIKDGIYIYKMSPKRVLYKQLPIATIYSYKKDKWGFINDYWKHHYKLFL